MKNLVLTMGIGEQGQQFLALTLPPMQAYARRIGADCHVINQATLEPAARAFEKFQIRGFFRRYKRILYLDADVVVMPHAPNVFKQFPPRVFAAWDEDTLHPYPSLLDAFRHISGTNEDWGTKVFNAGVFLSARRHASLFENVSYERAEQLPLGRTSALLSDQNYLNWKLSESKTECLSLPVFWNWNPMCGYIHPRAYFVHFLGSGFFEPERDRDQPPQDANAKRLRQITDLIDSFATGVKAAAPATDLCVTSAGVRSAVPLPHYFFPAGRYNVTFILKPPVDPATEAISCSLFGKKNDSLIVAQWSWSSEETRVTRQFATHDLAYPQFCFATKVIAARVVSVEIDWVESLPKPPTRMEKALQRLTTFFGRSPKVT